MTPGITYNRKSRIGAVGPSAWAKLGPEKWFDDYVIVCANSRGYKAGYVVDLGLDAADIEGLTTQFIVDSHQFQALVQDKLPDYRFVVYKPVKVPAGMDQARFIANNEDHKRFENKRVFREIFADKLPLPEHRMVALNELLALMPEQAYRRFSEELGGPKFVVQDELNGGGRGTFIIRSEDDMGRALQILKEERMGEICIVSKFIEGIERSIQVFVSANNVAPGPLQQQLIRNLDLLNPDERGGMFFCGGRLVHDASDKVKRQVEDIVQTVSSELQAAGYRGIFGLDFLLDGSENVFAIEINARTTGLLPLLNEQPTALPLYLLHVLELAGESYEITPAETAEDPLNAGPASFLVLFNKENHDVSFDDAVSTGNYRLVGDKLEQIDDSPRWHPEADVMLQLFCSPDFPAPPNLKLCNIFLKEVGFDEQGALTGIAREKVDLLKRHIIQNNIRGL